MFVKNTENAMADGRACRCQRHHFDIVSHACLELSCVLLGILFVIGNVSFRKYDHITSLGRIILLPPDDIESYA